MIINYVVYTFVYSLWLGGAAELLLPATASTAANPIFFSSPRSVPEGLLVEELFCCGVGDV